ncbi:hypothetical protein ACFL36_06145, partial [Thermodesulfobacteriota bacterium]
ALGGRSITLLYQGIGELPFDFPVPVFPLDAGQQQFPPCAVKSLNPENLKSNFCLLVRFQEKKEYVVITMCYLY